MSADNSERTRKAARDGYLELLRDATRKECNAPDEDGMTATHWAAFQGNLDALRIIVGRGGDPSKSDYFGNTALHWSAANGHYNCVSFLVSFGVNLWSLDNQYHSAKEVAALNNSPDSLHVIQVLDHVIAKQSALNTKVVQKMKEKALAEAEKRIKAFQKMQTKTTKQAEKEEKLREKHRKKNLCLLNAGQEGVYSDLHHNETHIYEMPPNGRSHTSQHQSTVSSKSSTMKFSDLVNSSIKSSKSSTARMKILSGVSRKVLIRKQNSTDTMKPSEGAAEAAGSRSVYSLVGIRRDDQIMYVPKYGSLSVSNLATNLSDDALDQSKHLSNSRLHLRDVFNLEGINNKSEPKTNTFNKNTKSSIKSRLLKFNQRHLSHKDNRGGGSLYRTISEPDFMFLGENQELEAKNDSLPESSSIFERPGFGSVSFRGKFTPESLFFMPRYYRADSAGNSEDDADSGHDHSHDSNGGTFGEKYREKALSSSLSPDRDSFATDSIGSAGSLAQVDCLEDHFEVSQPLECVSDSTSIPVLLFLYAHGLKEYYDVFEAEKIDIDALMLLTEDDLVSLAIPLGPRRKLLNAIRQRRLLIDNHGHVFETKL